MTEGDAVGWYLDDGTEMSGTLERHTWIGIAGQVLSVIVTPSFRYFVRQELVWSVSEVQGAREALGLIDTLEIAAVAAKHGLITAGLPSVGSEQNANGELVAATGL